jgi:hypothetical protein
MDLFKEVLPSLTSDKENLLDLNPEEEKHYPAFMVNRAFSMGLETFMRAAIINQLGRLDNRLQYDYWFYGLPQKRVWNRWIKSSKESKGFQAVQKFFDYSDQKTLEVMRLLTDEEVADIIRQMNPGS